MVASPTLAPAIEPYSPEDLERALARDDAAPAQEALSRSHAPAELLGRPSLNRLIRFALEEWALIAACWWAMTHTTPWLYPLWAMLIGGRLHALGVILHDACHMPLRRKTWRHYVLEALAGYPVFSTIEGFRYHHLRHHRDSGMPTDPYFKETVKTSRLAYFGILARQLLMPIGWGGRAFMGLCALAVPQLRNPYARIPFQDKSGQDLTHDPEVLRCCRAELGQAIFEVGLIALFVWDPWAVTFYFLIPNVLAWIFSGYRILSEHIYVPNPDRRMDTLLATTQDHHIGWWGTLFFAPRNIGFHIVHHFHPQVALENLPALRRWYQSRYPERYPKPYGQRDASWYERGL